MMPECKFFEVSSCNHDCLYKGSNSGIVDVRNELNMLHLSKPLACLQRVYIALADQNGFIMGNI